MPIDFYSSPNWAYGAPADRAIDIKTLWKKFYANYDADVNYPMYSGPSAYGFYIVSMHTSSQSVYRSGTNLSGCYPTSWCGPGANVNDTRVLISLNFTSAKRRFEIVQKIVETSLNHDCRVELSSRWVNTETETVDSSMTAPGWATSMEYRRALDGTSGTPGNAIISAKPGISRKLYGFTTASFTTDEGGNYVGYAPGVLIDVNILAAKMQEVYSSMDFSTYDSIDESPEAGPVSHQGGYSGGTLDLWSSDSVGVPDLPTLSSTDIGFVNMYAPQAGDLQELGEEIFPDFDFDDILDPTGNDIVDAVLNASTSFVSALNQLPKMFSVFMNSRLIDYVQDVHIVPFNPTVSGTGPIKLGYRTLNLTCPIVTSDYVSMDLGTINIKEVFAQFLDFQPFTRAKLYLPFVGFVPIEPEYWQNGELGVVYHANVRDGSFMCYVTSSPARVEGMVSSVIGQYAGTACIHIPLTGLNYSSMISGLVGGAAQTMAGIAGGNPAAGAMAALNTAAAAPQVQSSNGYTGSAAFMGVRYPFLLIERTVSHYPEKYQHDKGIPSKITTNLGGASGFVRVGDVDLSGIQANEAEKDEIRRLLADGIYVN